MYDFKEFSKDSRILKIFHKAKELGDKDLQNLELIQSLIQTKMHALNAQEKEKISLFLNDLLQAKQKAGLSS